MKVPGPNPHLPVFQLNPGNAYFSEKPEVVATILGSCLGIVMYSPRLKITTVCHAQLPTNPAPHAVVDQFKYVDTSFHSMYRWMIDHNLKDWEIEVKLFGGGDVLQVSTDKKYSNRRIGMQNVESALRLILNSKLQVISIDVGGETGRKLFIYTHTGEVYLKKIGNTDPGQANRGRKSMKAALGLKRDNI